MIKREIEYFELKTISLMFLTLLSTINEIWDIFLNKKGLNKNN